LDKFQVRNFGGYIMELFRYVGRNIERAKVTILLRNLDNLIGPTKNMNSCYLFLSSEVLR
uniref:FBD domain-containing protein n=1 Tax=Brugia timori TaxID=42155 RepID=A0A0R3QT69_9BILA